MMRAIEANPTYSQRDIARSLGISLGTVNYCLNALILPALAAIAGDKQRDWARGDRKDHEAESRFGEG